MSSYERKSHLKSRSQPLIIVNLTSPLVIRRRRQTVVSVTVTGHPTPRVTWLGTLLYTQHARFTR